jgi:hypothetical protein
MTDIVLFNDLKLPLLGTLSGRRVGNFPDRPYVIDASGSAHYWSADVNQVKMLGRGMKKLNRLLLQANRPGGELKVGPIFTSPLIERSTRQLIIDFGIVDKATIYLQMFEVPRIELDDEDLQIKLMECFHLLAEDAASLPPGTGGPRSRLAR